VKWVQKNIKKKSEHSLENGILYLKGGNLKAELQAFPNAAIYNLKDHFSDSFFDTKKLVHLPLKFRG
jgi:16S rRNA (guanine527-N7)-methyltransferase